MTHHVLIKVYGHVWPIAPESVDALKPHFPVTEHDDLEEILCYEKDMLRISFEGMYLDMEEILPLIQSFLQPTSQGKIDYIDLDAWTLTRHTITQGFMTVNTASLNVVMDYSGH